MSLSVKNGGIGKSPAISRVTRLSPKETSKAITKDMLRSVKQKETRAKTGKGSIIRPGAASLSSGEKDLWNPLVPAALNPCYPKSDIRIDPLIACVSDAVSAYQENAK